MITKKDQKALQNNIAILMLIFSVVAIFLVGRLLLLQVFDRNSLDTQKPSRVGT